MNQGRDLRSDFECMLYCLDSQSSKHILDDSSEVNHSNSADKYKMDNHRLVHTLRMDHKDYSNKDSSVQKHQYLAELEIH